MPAPKPRGRFVWHELLTSDPDGAIAFYTKVIGWKTQVWAGDDSYRMWVTSQGSPVGGVMALPAEAKAMGATPYWLSYLSVDDTDLTTERALELGARVLVAPRDIPGVGRFAVLSDPQGATFAVHHSTEEAPPPIPGEIGEFSWHELATTDYRAAWEFYETLFGWEATESMDMGAPVGVYWMFGFKGKSIGGMFTKPPQIPMAHWLPYVRVSNAHDAASQLSKQGGMVMNGPMEVPGGDQILQASDPQGAAFALQASPAAVSAPPERKARKAAAAAPKTAKKVSKKAVKSQPVKPKPRTKPLERKKAAKTRAKSTPKKTARKAPKTTKSRRPVKKSSGRRSR